MSRRIKIQAAVFTAVAVVAGAVMLFGYIKAPERWFGLGRYTVTVDLPQSGGLYKNANVTYRGTEVGSVEDVRLTGTGVAAVLSLASDIKIPSDLRAEVHSVSAIGEQYVALLPRNATSPPLKNGDVIAVKDVAVPTDINRLLDTTNRGLQAIPRDNLKTVIDESYTAVGGLGPELRRLIQGSTQLAIDSHQNLDELTTLIDQSKPVLDSQADTSNAIQGWAANLANITSQLRTHNDSVAGFLQSGASAAREARQLFERVQPTLPVVLANLVSAGAVAVTYQPAIEQLLVLLPQGISMVQGTAVANINTKGLKGTFLDFNLNLNLPPPCATGFLPPQQTRTPNFEDYPDRPAGDLYCRVPQDSMFNVRGARNYPCLTVPGKRAPTVKMCESDDQYVPLNDGFAWKGDPNATSSGQDVPQLPPGSSSPPASKPAPAVAPPPVPALATAEYDPATGTYVGPDGKVYRQTDLAHTAPKEQTWESMLVPPAGK